MNVTFTLKAGSSNTAAGPFNISGTTSGGALNGVSIATAVTKAQLLTGHTVNSVLDTITGGTIASTGTTCPSSTTTWSVITATPTPTPTATPTPTPTFVVGPSTFNVYVSENSKDIACNGGDAPGYSVYHQFVISGDTTDICTSNSFTCNFIPTFDYYSFWISDGTNSRLLHRTGPVGSTDAVPDEACVSCVP
jgi:hypothetical protein